MRITALALALAAAGSAAAQASAPPGGTAGAPSASPAPPASASLPQPSKEGAARGTALEEVSGKVASFDRRAHLLRVETAAGPVTLSLDRNTMVYTGTGLGTVFDVTPGVQIRAGRNAEFLAYGVLVRAPPAPPASATEVAGPGTGTAPSAPAAGPGTTTGPGPAGAAPAVGTPPR